MNSRHHARLARQLIDACGGLDEAVRECRVGKSALSDYQNPHITAFMPADVMADLEAYCGQAIYSGAIAAERPTAPSDCALAETHEAVQAAAALLPLAMKLATGGAKAKAAFDDAVAKFMAEARDVQAIADSNVLAMKGAAA